MRHLFTNVRTKQCSGREMIHSTPQGIALAVEHVWIRLCFNQFC